MSIRLVVPVAQALPPAIGARALFKRVRLMRAIERFDPRSPREHQVLELRYGIGWSQGHSFEDIGAEVGGFTAAHQPDLVEGARQGP